MKKKNKKIISKQLSEEIKICINSFKVDLSNSVLADNEIVKKHIIDGAPFYYKNNINLYNDLKNEIAKGFSVNANDIIMVGSAKLGFSIAPGKLWREFCVDSDIDMAIISNTLFDEFWNELYDFNIYLKPRSADEDTTYRKFLYAFFKGWFRPDLFPFKFSRRSDWFKFFQSLSYQKYGEKKITCGIFKNYEFFIKYHASNIKQFR